jgi:putative ABC transport system permease protein
MGELALAFVLVTGSGLFGKSFVRLLGVELGFDARHLLTLQAFLYGERYQKAEAELGYYEQAMEKVGAIPGVEGIAMTSVLPFRDFDRRGFHLRDRKPARASDVRSADTYSVSPDYFRTMRIPILRGRGFTAQDREGAPLVAVISVTCARDEFAGRDPIGKQIQLGGRDDSKPWMTIVGVVGDIRQYGLEMTPRLAAYIPQAQNMSFGFSTVVRTAGDPERVKNAVVAAFESVDRTQPVNQVRTMESYLSSSLAERRFTLILILLFGSLALVLAAVGIYGVVSYAVAARMREMGIRAALGARGSDLAGMVMADMSAKAAVGLGVGVAGALAVTRFLASLLYEIQPTDLVVWSSTAAVLVLVVVCASFVPARRAAAADPTVALRMD